MRKITLLRIDLLLELLDRGKKWHSIDEIVEKISLSRPEALHIINLLARYRFIILTSDGQKAKVAREMHEFLKEISQEERRSLTHGVKRFSTR